MAGYAKKNYFFLAFFNLKKYLIKKKILYQSGKYKKNNSFICLGQVVEYTAQFDHSKLGQYTIERFHESVIQMGRE